MNLEQLISTMLGAMPMGILEYGSTVRGYGRPGSDRDLLVVYKDVSSVSILEPTGIRRSDVFDYGGAKCDAYFIEVREFMRRVAAMDIQHLIGLHGRIEYGTEGFRHLITLAKHSLYTTGKRDFLKQVLKSLRGLLVPPKPGKEETHIKNHVMAVFLISMVKSSLELDLSRALIMPDVQRACYVEGLSSYVGQLRNGQRRLLKAEELAGALAWVEVQEKRVEEMPEINRTLPKSQYVLEWRKGDETTLSVQLNQILNRSLNS